MMQKKALLFLFGLLALQLVRAQLFHLSSKETVKLKGRKLVVVLPEEKQFYLDKYKRKDQRLAQYRNIIASTNKLLQEVFPVYWTVSEDVLFRKESELGSLGQDTSFIVMRYRFNEKVFDLEPGVSTYQLRKTLVRQKLYGTLELSLMEKQKAGPIISFYVPTSYPFEEDMIAAVSQLNYFLVIKQVRPVFSMKEYEKIIEDRNENVTRRTLLIDTAQTEKYFGDYYFIQEDYPYPYKLTATDEIARAIKNKDSAFAYVAVFPHHDQINRGGTFEGTSGGGMDAYSATLFFTHLVIDCANFEIIGIGKNLDPFINKRAIKHYIKDIDTPNKNSENIIR